MTGHRIFRTSFASVYPHYVAKAEKKGRTKAEVDEVIRWLTGFSQEELDRRLAEKTDFETFFVEAPSPHPARAEIKGVVCGVRVEEIDDLLMREIRRLDKLVDELAKGKAMETVLRGTPRSPPADRLRRVPGSTPPARAVGDRRQVGSTSPASASSGRAPPRG